MKKSIGILGGMGPMATADIFTKIVAHTKAGADSEHIRIYIDNDPAIPDRTAAILAGGNDPVPEMTAALRNLERCGADCILLPCNTAHYFLPRLQAMTDIPFLSMPEATARACARLFPGKTAGLMATRGTLSTGLYEKAMVQAGVKYAVPDEAGRDALMRVIYEGVKADADPESYRDGMALAMDGLKAQGADYFVLACTELPLAFSLLDLQAPFIDPTLELALEAIRFCGYETK